MEIDAIAAGGAGVGRVDGRTYFVEGSAPGERVAARVIEEKPSWSKAELVEILRPSAERIAPACPLYGVCGGCTLQHLDYRAQVREKKRMLTDAFTRIGGFSGLPAIQSFESPPYEYRNRMQFHRAAPKNARPGDGKTRVGLMPRSGDRVVPVDDCPIADPGLRNVLRAKTLAAPPWADRFNVYARGGTLLVEGGDNERGTATILGKSLRLDVKGFFQSNAIVLETLIAEILDAADSADTGGRACDLYCGIGTFGAFLADRFERVDMVERDKTTLALARENVRRSGARHFAVSDDDWSGRKESREEPYAFAVVDPPRVGLSTALRRWLVERQARLLAYVSCDAATLARDARELTAGGYRLRTLSFFDFYPQTAHMEALALFEGTR